MVARVFSELPTTGGAGPAPLYQTGAVTGAPAMVDTQLGGVRSVVADGHRGDLRSVITNVGFAHNID